MDNNKNASNDSGLTAAEQQVAMNAVADGLVETLVEAQEVVAAQAAMGATDDQIRKAEEIAAKI